MSTNQKIVNQKNKNKLNIDKILAITALITIAIAWFAGSRRASSDLLPAIHQVMPQADYIEMINDDLYGTYLDETKQTLIGFVAIAEADGYGGPLTLAVGVQPDGSIANVVIVDHKETRAWMKRVLNASYLEIFPQKPYQDAFILGEDIDGVTGATYTSKAIAEAALEGSREVATYLGFPVDAASLPEIVFGIPEITLIALYTFGFFAHQRKFKYKKQARWATLLIGLIVLGFIYNKPLTISAINQLLLGFWPQWQTNLYWYLLLGGIIFVFTVDNKNPYCYWFCPFGAAQECMGALGNSKVRSPGIRVRNILKWTQRMLAWLAIVLALWFRNPGISSYEIFGTLFKFVGSSWEFILLGVVLIVSLFISRPWCTYLCPLHSVDEFIRLIRKWIFDIWYSLKKKRNA